MIAKALGLEEPVPAAFEAPRPGDVRHSLADITRARQVLGYHAAVDTAEGLRRTVAWYRQALTSR